MLLGIPSMHQLQGVTGPFGKSISSRPHAEVSIPRSVFSLVAQHQPVQTRKMKEGMGDHQQCHSKRNTVILVLVQQWVVPDHIHSDSVGPKRDQNRKGNHQGAAYIKVSGKIDACFTHQKPATKYPVTMHKKKHTCQTEPASGVH